MLEKKDYVVGAIVFYVFLVMLFFMVQDKHSIETPCAYDQPCVRFCCKDSSACKEKHIRENFNASLLTVQSEANETKDFIILLGQPKCSLKTIPENDTSQEREFYFVSSKIIK
jgi:hypothetical protein